MRNTMMLRKKLIQAKQRIQMQAIWMYAIQKTWEKNSKEEYSDLENPG